VIPCREVESWANTTHPNQGDDLSLYSANGLEYKKYTPNMGRHAQYGPIQIHRPIQCLIIGSRGPQHFAKALPSEDGGEHPGEARWRPTCAWGWPVGYPRSYSTGVFIPLRGHSVERGSNNED